MNRNINNLLEWKRDLELKKERNIQEMFYNEAKPKINPQSKLILGMRNPDYLYQKVEDRLHNNNNCNK